ncbi:condensation domain-containing protein, partial [Paenibacillus sp. 23TSA30-6]|uniref:condensation domain-containing protein n=1 Tax=Paenibacillus sp. 23TSA30-6 TaxID=2546104 RepID=UPI001788699A
SGTTGNAKGVMIEQRHYVNTAWGYREAHQLKEFQVKLLQIASMSFDVFAGDLAKTFVNGGTMVICPQDVRNDPPALAKVLEQHEITTFEVPPALLTLLMDYVYEHGTDISAMKLLTTGADSFGIENYRTLLNRFGDKMRIMNTYGVTEAAIDSSFYEETAERLPPSGIVPIGKALPNHKVYIVDEALRPLPIGVAGELCLGGASVARGYLNRPDLTAEKFVPNPFVSGERLYRTGDLARWLPDGNIDFIGRVDFQVKIRGYRIELGEVETHMLRMEAVQEAVVLAHLDEHGQNQLVAYYVAKWEVSMGELRSYLGQKLPNHMVPSYFVQLVQFPLTPNGKIDRKALPAPEGNLQRETEYIAPRTWLEAKLSVIWQDVLGLIQVGVKENFFEIGGHSLRAMTLVLRIYKELNKPIPLRSIFDAPTIEQLAVVIENLNEVAYASILVAEERPFYTLSSAQKRMYILHRIDPGDVSYNMPAVLQVSGPLDVRRVEAAFRQLISRHEAFRTSFEMVNNEPVQRIQERVPFEVEYAKVQEKQAGTDALAFETEIEKLVSNFVNPFDLQAAPLLRVALLDLNGEGTEETQHLLMIDMHHIISDGVSTSVLTREFVRLYSGEKLPPLRIQYKDYAVWQQSEAQKDWMKRQEAYWLDTFRSELPVLNLPTDFARPAVRSTAGDTVVFKLEREVSERLKELAAQTGSTLYMVLLAAYTALLHQYTGQEDIIVGTPIAGRPHADLEPIIGMFVGTLAMRNYPTAKQTFRSYVEDVKTQALQAYEHQDYPFEELVDKLNVKRDMGRNPLFDTMFILQNTEEGELKLEDIRFRPYDMEQAPVKFDLMLEASEEEEGIRFELQYATSLYERKTIEQITRHFIQLSEAIVVNPDIKLGELEWITEVETVHVLRVHQERQKASRYWSAYLDGYEEACCLPQAKTQSRAECQTEHFNVALSPSLMSGIQRISNRYQVNQSTLIQTVWGILLQKYNDTDDVVFGSTLSGNEGDIPNKERMFSLILNTLPVRITSSENNSFWEVMKQTQKQSVASSKYDAFSLYEIQKLSELKQNLINHILIFENDWVEEQSGQLGDDIESHFSITGVESVEQSNYDFNLVVLSGKKTRMSFSYNALVFDRESIKQIYGHLVHLLEQVVVNPGIQVHEMKAMTEQECKQILAGCGDMAIEYPNKQTIHGLFEAQVLQTPEQVALFFEGEQLTYLEMNERANSLARVLQAHGVGPDKLVGLMV